MTNTTEETIESWEYGWPSDPGGVSYHARCPECGMVYCSGDRQQANDAARGCC